MKNIFLLHVCFFCLIRFSSFGQNFSINPSQSNRGQSLVTTVTPVGAMMTISSGSGSLYHFTLEQGSYVIQENSYTYSSSGLGFATSFDVTFVIPYSALPGLYDFHIKHQWWSQDAILYNSFQVFETAVEGRVYFDGNQNGIYDSNDQGLNHQTISINPLNSIAITDNNGKYHGYLNPGTFKDSLLLPPNFSLTSASSSYTISVPPDTSGLDFGIYTPPSATFIHNFISDGDRLRCQRPSAAFWSASSGSNNVQNGTVTLIKDTGLIFVNSLPLPNSNNNDTIRWSYTLLPFETLTAQLILQGGVFNSTSGFTIVDSLFDTLGTFISTSENLINSHILCSYDPNEKSVSPEGIDSINHYTLKGDDLKYTIRFQNCGSDTAFNITIRDTIDNFLDLNTMQILYSSAPMIAQIESNNKIRFTFSNIFLPDSGTDELHSHGIIIYSIKAKANIPDFTIIKNRAYIYFDLNDAVKTNSTFNTMVSQLNVGMENLFPAGKSNVYPNPVTGKSVLILPDKKNYLLNIYTLTGENIISVATSENYVINSNQLHAGMYYYQLLDIKESKTFSGKFVITK